jgi:hypothetical protein
MAKVSTVVSRKNTIEGLLKQKEFYELMIVVEFTLKQKILV